MEPSRIAAIFTGERRELRRAVSSHVLVATLALVGAGLLADVAAAAERSQVPEYELKAEFLVRFLGFVEWETGAATDRPMVLGVIGEDPFGPALDERVRGRQVGGRDLQVRRVDDLDAIPDCELLFVAVSDDRSERVILARAGSAGVLTVGEREGFARAGGVIEFFREGETIRFEINPEAARAAGIRVSSQLLSLARITDGTASADEARSR